VKKYVRLFFKNSDISPQIIALHHRQEYLVKVFFTVNDKKIVKFYYKLTGAEVD
jgi:hypothetical protein